jgi:hypothetical protein
VVEIRQAAKERLGTAKHIDLLCLALPYPLSDKIKSSWYIYVEQRTLICSDSHELTITDWIT